MDFMLVGGITTPLKNMKVNWDDDSQYFPIYGKIKNVPNHQPVWDNQHDKHFFFPGKYHGLLVRNYGIPVLASLVKGHISFITNTMPRKWTENDEPASG